MKAIMVLVTLAVTIAILALGTTATVLQISFGRRCTQWLELAAVANTIPLAQERLDTAITEIERRGLTCGSSHVLYSTPSTLLGPWYDNLKAAQSELRSMSGETDHLIVSNVLMKLRESLTEDRQTGQAVIMPPHLALYPNHRFYMWGTTVGIVVVVVLWICVLAVSIYDM